MAEDKDKKNITNKMGTIFPIKCYGEDFDHFDQICKKYFNDSRRTMLTVCLETHFSLAPVLEDINEKLELLTHLTNRVLALEDKVNKKKSIKMNDGSELEVEGNGKKS